jgi:hypothetical protein
VVKGTGSKYHMWKDIRNDFNFAKSTSVLQIIHIRRIVSGVNEKRGKFVFSLNAA